MVSYNDVTKLTYYSEHNKDKELIDLFCSICGSNNIIDILQFIKSERFVEENSSIKLLFDDKELLIFKENFLLPIKYIEKLSLFYEYIYSIINKLVVMPPLIRLKI